MLSRLCNMEAFFLPNFFRRHEIEVVKILTRGIVLPLRSKPYKEVRPVHRHFYSSILLLVSIRIPSISIICQQRTPSFMHVSMAPVQYFEAATPPPTEKEWSVSTGIPQMIVQLCHECTQPSHNGNIIEPSQKSSSVCIQQDLPIATKIPYGEFLFSQNLLQTYMQYFVSFPPMKKLF